MVKRLPPDIIAPSRPQPQTLQRYDGAVSVTIGQGGVSALRQTPPMRLFRPYAELGEPETIVIGNISGGVTGGDRLAMSIRAEGAPVLAVTQAAEKVYRSHGGAARMSVDLTATDGGALEFLSSGTILFDGAELERSTTLSVEGDARLMFVEILMFGRAAREEQFRTGRLRDRIRLLRDGKLVWMDDLALGPGPLDQLSASAGFAGATASGTLILTGVSARDLRDRVRQACEGIDDVRHGVVVLDDGTLLMRALGARADHVRRMIEAVCMRLRADGLGRPERMPTIWSV
jgi:urease accessory protein